MGALNKSILIIEDDDELRDLLRITFESKDFEVYTAVDGVEGLKSARKKLPKAIVLDIKMPRLNGYEFLSRMRKDPKIASIPVVVLTSLTDASNRSDEEWARSMEVTDFISKPVEPFHLVERVERAFAAP